MFESWVPTASGRADTGPLAYTSTAAYIVAIDRAARQRAARRTQYGAEQWPWIEIVIASGNVTPCPGDMPGKATFIGKPFDDRMLQQRLTETLPDNK